MGHLDELSVGKLKVVATQLPLTDSNDLLKLKTKNGNYRELLEGEMPKTIWSMKIPPTKKSE